MLESHINKITVHWCLYKKSIHKNANAVLLLQSLNAQHLSTSPQLHLSVLMEMNFGDLYNLTVVTFLTNIHKTSFYTNTESELVICNSDKSNYRNTPLI